MFFANPQSDAPRLSDIITGDQHVKQILILQFKYVISAYIIPYTYNNVINIKCILHRDLEECNWFYNPHLEGCRSYIHHSDGRG
jgi:hypothetical protein